jgi:hypothetical protein
MVTFYLTCFIHHTVKKDGIGKQIFLINIVELSRLGSITEKISGSKIPQMGTW